MEPITKVKPKKASGRTLSQAERRAVGGKETVSITLSAEGKEALDLLRGSESRGAFLENLLEEIMKNG